jgi:uncharacterized protein YegP (UPF0339 family)
MGTDPTYRCEVYKADDGWRWRRKADNGEIIATGESYTRKHDAKRSAERNFPDDFIREEGQSEEEDVGPPPPGGWNEGEYPNPEFGSKC